MSRFVTRRDPDPIPESPEQLFRLLRPRDPSVAFLWSHQADILRDYARNAAGMADVALELPTGAGKTLVGLLIGEFRRRTEGHRVAVLCPTRHLARQVGDKAAAYGLRAHVLVGRQQDWPPAEYMAYERADAIAVTTYAALFNTSPRLDDVQTLILDDAHAAEGPVADLWSVAASRDDSVYDAIRGLVDDVLPAAFAERLRDDFADPRERRIIEIVPPHELEARASQIREVLSAHATGDAQYGATMIAGHLGACVLYMTWDSLLIRPAIVPSRTHHPFSDAVQRVYMSATLGEGGELERAFGVPNIRRLPVPEGWKDHGSGRRFFLFPSAAMPIEEVNEFVRSAVNEAGRSLVIAPSKWELDQTSELCLPERFPTLVAADVEADRDALARHDRAALLLTRYDGMDFPDDVCRLIVLSGLPAAGHLQERFVYERLGARRVLAERVRARIVQGAGRCTRNANDYAAVIIRGEGLTEFLSRSENRQSMQPELQAEIEFGLRNSEVEADELLGHLRSFLEQDEDWSGADATIEADASQMRREPSANAAELSAAARLEVETWQLAWMGDLAAAATSARRVADALEGGAVLRPYRCLWLYLAASWAKAAAATQDDRDRASAYMRDAVSCGRHLSWRPREDREPLPRFDQDVTARSVRAAATMAEVGLVGNRFEREAQELLERLTGTDATPFELGLQSLGRFLGFESHRPPGQAAPDAVWRDEDAAWILLEAKSEGDPAIAISAGDVRQANGHKQWVLSQLEWPEPQYAITCLVTARTRAEASAAALAGPLACVSPARMVRIARDVLECYRALRPEAVGLSAEELPARIAREFRDRDLDTDSLALRLTEQAVSRMAPRSTGSPG